MANVDTAEIEKFENLASRWWDKNSEFKPLHDINPLRANYIDRRSPVAERLFHRLGFHSHHVSSQQKPWRNEVPKPPASTWARRLWR